MVSSGLENPIADIVHTPGYFQIFIVQNNQRTQDWLRTTLHLRITLYQMLSMINIKLVQFTSDNLAIQIIWFTLTVENRNTQSRTLNPSSSRL